MECQKKLLADLAIIQDPETTPGSHHTEVLSLYILAGTMLLSSIIMLTKSLGRRMLSDIFFLVFFFVGALGFGLLGFASQVYVAGENWAVILAKILITLSLASLLLNNCCVLEDLAPFRFRTLGKHLQGTMLFMTMMSVSCTFTWSVAHYLKKSNAQEYCLKAFCSFLAAAGSLTVAILEPTCGYAGHKKCYTEDFLLGDRVLIKAAKEEPKAWEGTVRFIGITDFATGEWLGVELDIKAGKNDGSVHGKRYFQCEDKYGLFLRPSAVQKFKASSPRDIALEKAKVQEALALAMEDHDIQTIRRVLPAAESLGIDPKEIHFARQILDSVASYDLQGEVKGLCSSLLKLRRTLENIEASSSGRPGATQGTSYQELERRLLSESLPKVLEHFMQGAGAQRPCKAGKAGAAGSQTDVPQANRQKPAGIASASTAPAPSEGSVKQKFRKNLMAGLKDGSLETVVKSIPDTGQ